MMQYLKLFGLAALSIGLILYLASHEEHQVVMGDQHDGLKDFTKITVNTVADVKVRVGDRYGLHVKADEADLKFLKVYVKGQTLVIDHKKKLFQKWHGDRPIIGITLPRLRKFTLNGASEAEIEGIHGYYFQAVVNGRGQLEFSGATREFQIEIHGQGNATSSSFAFQEGDVEINGSGNLTMVGKCGFLELSLYGSGSFAGQGLKCDKVEVEIVGSGDAEVYVQSKLVVEVLGSGEVEVYGNPKKIQDNSPLKKHVTIHSGLPQTKL